MRSELGHISLVYELNVAGFSAREDFRQRPEIHVIPPERLPGEGSVALVGAEQHSGQSLSGFRFIFISGLKPLDRVLPVHFLVLLPDPLALDPVRGVQNSRQEAQPVVKQRGMNLFADIFTGLG
nr:hypothetical protein Iba_scaffold20877CG0010 [Ipomoea batatas]